MVCIVLEFIYVLYKNINFYKKKKIAVTSEHYNTEVAYNEDKIVGREGINTDTANENGPKGEVEKCINAGHSR